MTSQTAVNHEHALDVFVRIEQLLLSSGTEAQFWQECIAICVSLGRTPYVGRFEMADENWHIGEMSSDLGDLGEQTSESFQVQAASLCQRLLAFEKGFLFEPLKLGSAARDDELAAFSDHSKPFLLGIAMYGEDSAKQFLVFVLDQNDKETFNEIVVRLQLVRHFYNSYQNRKQRDIANTKVADESFLYVLEILDKVVNKEKFTVAAMTLVNELALKLNCERVSIGVLKEDYLKTVAISHSEEFDKNSEAVLNQEVLFEEAADQETVICVPDTHRDRRLITQAHDKQLASQALSQLVTLPLVLDSEVAFCLTLARSHGQLSTKELQLVEVVMAQLAPWLKKMQYQDLWLPQKARVKAHQHVRWWMGPKNTLAKFFALSFSLLLLIGLFVQLDYEVETVATLETDNISYLFAPYDGYVKEVHVHAGDEVFDGEVLLSLDKAELRIKALEEEANMVRYKSEADKARSRKKLVDMKISLAQISQSQSELERIQYYLNRADLVSPFNGIVVDGDREELLGAPVNKGDLLLKVANPTDLYVRLKLSEEDIDQISVGQSGELKLISRPDQSFGMTIEKIVPVALVDGAEGNVFWVKAKLDDDAQKWWRPGMSGVAHIHVGERSILWLLLHRTVDSVRMALWI